MDGQAHGAPHHLSRKDERAVYTQPSSSACSLCKRPTRFVRAPHSSGGAWQVRAWCDACQTDAVPGHIWWSKKLFTTEQLAALEQQPAVRSTQLLLECKGPR